MGITSFKHNYIRWTSIQWLSSSRTAGITSTPRGETRLPSRRRQYVAQRRRRNAHLQVLCHQTARDFA